MRIRDTELHVAEPVGAGDLLVLVHGGWTDHTTWDAVVDGLAESFRVVRYDRRGHSRSPYGPGPSPRRRDEDDLAALIEAFGGPAHLVGTSYGAMISLALAGRRPDLVRSVIAHEPPLLGLAPEPAVEALFAEIQDQLAGGDADGGTRRFFEEVALGPGAWELLPAPLRAAAVANAQTFVDLREDPDCMTLDVGAVARFGGPIVVTAGDAGPAWLPRAASVAAARIGRDLRVIPGAGHAPHLTHPGALVALVREVLGGRAVERSTMKDRHQLPHLADRPFITDGGIETTLIFHEGLELPLFAAFDLLKDEQGTAALRRYFEPYAELAREHGVGLVLESPTWRANPRWAEQIGYGLPALAEMNRRAIALLEGLRERYESDATPVVISGCVGPHDDGYDPRDHLTAAAARDYHSTQIETFATTAADLVTAITMTYVEEATGVTRAAVDAGMPVVISFTVETDGRLPSGQSLEDAIRRVDDDTGGAPAYYMINCAHPTHFAEAIEDSEVCRERIRGLRANASTKSHAELDEAEELDAGDPADLAARHAALRGTLPRLQVLGGCCGTDHRHVGSICSAWLAEAAA